MATKSNALANWHSLNQTLGGDCLRVASYNIHRCIGRDRLLDVERVAQVIRELGCDVIGLQEVDNRSDGRHDSMQLDYLAQATATTPVAGNTIVHHQGSYGNALLSRHPVVAIRRHDFSYLGREPRGALEVDVAVGDRVISIVVTHLGLRPIERRFQVRQMLGLLREIPADQMTVVLGDINEWLPMGRPLRWLHGMLGHSPAERSFPSGLPLFALDRVWVRPRRSLLAFTTHPSHTARVASDHLPVKALIATGLAPEAEKQ
ncbi:endonuclease/exonuclease/phosphatase family protein [Dechloromonas sp. A34]|uniref:endonuclease/exonuclease/phosphatase family protein n=1 Tax=Dechloromonas sp. A34 TaxID=447588 RepID=UPI00224963D1|nr:endonuclease/exonuclease/phosphatase family protein [Dechloromonas sp. A34]